MVRCWLRPGKKGGHRVSCLVRTNDNRREEFVISEEDARTRNRDKRTLLLPLDLAFAMTVHKAQGQTMDKVIVDLNRKSSGKFGTGALFGDAESSQAIGRPPAVTFGKS